MIKETMKKTGVVTGVKLEKMMFQLSCMSRADWSGAPFDLFLSRNVNFYLPNAWGKVISLKKEVERRLSLQSKQMKHLGRVS